MLVAAGAEPSARAMTPAARLALGHGGTGNCRTGTLLTIQSFLGCSQRTPLVEVIDER